jgi:hypothetical protein
MRAVRGKVERGFRIGVSLSCASLDTRLARLAYKAFQCVHVRQVIERLVDGSFGDERRVSGAAVIHEAAERLQPDASPSDVLVTVEL